MLSIALLQIILWLLNWSPNFVREIHFVAIQSVFFLTTCHLQKLQNAFRGKQHIATKCSGVFMLSHVIQKNAATKWLHSLTI